MSFPDRQRTEQRNQLVLNLARPEVKEYVFNVVDKLVTENDIAFLKWDYNRNWSEPGWDTAPEPKEIYVQYVQNLYDILARLRQKHPKLEIESCSGGGGRVDLGILRYTDEVWPSDNTDALDRLSIQDGFTHAYSPEVMVAWVTDVPNYLDKRVIPLQFRFLVAMQGALGVGGNLNKWSPQEMESSARLIAFYKGVRTTVQSGSLYRLARPVTHEASQVEYVAQDGSQAVVLAYLDSQHYGLDYPTVILQGLEPSAMYRIRALDPAKYSGESTVQGSVLMGVGLRLSLAGDYDSTALALERVR
jgi:alpha-galactosidase